MLTVALGTSPINFQIGIALCWALIFNSTTAISQVSITADGFSYVQNFNSLASSGTANPWTNNVTLAGWYALSQSAGFYTSYGASSGASSTSRLYSYGTTASDRALGSLNQDASGFIIYGVLFTNNSGTTINSIELSFGIEQWRRAQSTVAGFQRVKVSYQIGSTIDVTASGISDENLFIDIPEAYLITPDSTTVLASSALNGNDPVNADSVYINFPIVLAAGEQFFLRFLDENASSLDHAMAIDNLDLKFSSFVITKVTASTGHGISAYLDQGIVKDLPGEADGFTYEIPTAGDLSSWSTALSHFWNSNWTSINLGAYSYDLVEYVDRASSLTYYVLRKTESSIYFWGTYVSNLSPANEVLVLQSPHAVFDSYTGRQGAYTFEVTGARAFMMSGIHRCVSSVYSSCAGQTPTCSGGTNEPFRMSDIPHTDQSVFYVASTSLGITDENLVFVQMHGFGKGPTDPHFIISTGSLDGLEKSVPDYPVLLREELQAFDNTWTFKVAHVDNWSRLAGTTNTVGRYLNLYPYDNCSGGFNPPTASNRFLHLEQYFDVRRYIKYYSGIADAINNVVNANTYVSSISIGDVTDSYTQDFNALDVAASSHTWGNNLHIPGWYAAKESLGLFSDYLNSSGTVATGGLYSFGADGDGDRALGSISPETGVGNVVYGVLLENNTGTTIQSVILSYRAEQWRQAISATSSQRVKLSYRIDDAIDLRPIYLLDNTNFTAVSSGDIISLDDNSTTGAMDGNSNFTQLTNITFSAPWADGQQLFLRFFDESESDASKALSVDDLVVTFSSLVLPIRWLSVSIGEEDGLPKLTWSTAEEDECQKYEILRSTDAKRYEIIDEVECKGHDRNEYEYVDRDPPIYRSVYYKIRQKDFIGEESNSKVLVWQANTVFQPKISLDPHNGLIIDCGDHQIQSAILFDVMGRMTDTPRSLGQGRIAFDYAIDHRSILVVQVIVDGKTYTTRILPVR